MPAAFLLALGDLADRHILGILVRSLLITLALFALLGLALGWLLAGADPCAAFGDMECTLSATTGGIGALALTLAAIWFLFPAVAIGVICAYVERIAQIIERRHYPAAAERARSIGVGAVAWLGLRSALRVILYNLAALPFYILLLITGIGPLILFVIVNGIAFGRDLGEMVAARHGDRATRYAWLGETRLSRMLIGSAVTGLFLVPFLNLLAPVLGAAATVHLFHRRAA
ncbi:EI24 domain-containing protein [Rhizorhabdus dicambivorans]|uniref:Cysteine biosynthesis protein n=1 Tax=Rhizorhabdus dicambivorans TaxID=1850238 RepID=A0A2A4FX23_9SPHN|nr:EI24 domain-containing protein [Rhizorhabdus dicambivorans]ATE65598.1 hypothetical protein CMV14_15285 [Rhizorhabdus dicambivorans]PCE41941.1 hypothetical protein COO09_13040 [Rhizorhabdus dicambivorans]